MYINKTPTDNGNYGNPRSNGGGLALPDSLLNAYLDTMGFAILTMDGDTVTAVEVNREALDAYLAEHPAAPPEPPQPTQEERIAELEEAMDVLLSGLTQPPEEETEADDGQP